MIILILFAFLSGIVTILSPCILPVLPIILSGSVGGKNKPIGVILGFVTSFSIFTLVLSTLVQLLNIPSDALRVAAVVLIIMFGLTMVIPKFQELFEIFVSRFAGIKQTKPTNGFIGGIVVGLSLGLVWTPCVGPIIASAISLAVTQRVDGGAILIILAYSLGTAIPMFAIMLGGKNLIKRFPKLLNNSAKIQQMFGVLMILVGLLIATGFDRKFQTAVLKLLPNYGTGLTAVENNGIAQNVLKKRNNPGPTMMRVQSDSVMKEVSAKNSSLGDLGPAPEIVTKGAWINTDGKPLKMADLKGKVVLIDFWTYSCVNCIRTIPYLKTWYDRYKDQGLVIIGVHSPEFAFERNLDNVKKAGKELGVTWPVVLDNEFTQWNAYNNRYWPAEYFIDGNGKIRHTHFGEGEYKESENIIRELLREAGKLKSNEIKAMKETEIKSSTPEIYLGYYRSQGFVSQEMADSNQTEMYHSKSTLENGEWGLEGTWTIHKDYIAPDKSGELMMGFDAKSVYLVIEPEGKGGKIEIQLDGKPVENGVIYPVESKLYPLINLPESGKHLLKLKVEGQLRLFSFTFG